MTSPIILPTYCRIFFFTIEGKESNDRVIIDNFLFGQFWEKMAHTLRRAEKVPRLWILIEQLAQARLFNPEL